ncbi:inositol monophosphatase [Patescibacteria group bacterium]|nr:inositol monophosphatase [Patescibacteria group bacterium]
MTLLEFTIATARKAGKMIEKAGRKTIKIEEKSANDFVTETDRKVEDLIIKEIKKNFPDHAILGEETGESADLKDAEYIWIIDPIDGTNNFIRNLPFHAVSIAVFQRKISKSSKNFEYIEGEIVVGVVHSPALGKIYSAQKGKGAKLNGKPITVSPRNKVYRSILSTGFHGDYKAFNLPYFEAIIHKSQGIRRFGSAALDLCHVAEGKIEGYWEFGLKPWDIAAGALIVEEAGGRVTDTNGNTLDLFGKDLLATNKRIHKETVEIFGKIQ